jgi:RNA polymerase sigma-70 factor (ECF subfamily)
MLGVKGDDAALVARAQEGDLAAFEQLVRRHQRYVFNVAYRVLGDTAEAEDVTQEAFVRAWKGLPGFRGRAQFTTWLYRIAHNLCLNRLPGLRRQLAQIEPLEDLLSDPSPSPSESLEIRDRLSFVHAEIERMPEKYRLVLSLRYLQHLSYDEIASVLELPMGTVKTHIYRARQMLADRVRQWEEGPFSRADSEAGDVGKNAAILDRSITYALP